MKAPKTPAEQDSTVLNILLVHGPCIVSEVVRVAKHCGLDEITTRHTLQRLALREVVDADDHHDHNLRLWSRSRTKR